MSRIYQIIVLAVLSLSVVTENAKALIGVDYANPQLVDLAKDLNATVSGGNSPGGMDNYMPNTQDNFPIDSGPQTFQVNLGSPQAIGLIDFTKYAAGYGASAWMIERSVNGTDWTPVSSGDDSSPALIGDAGGAVAQYVRIVATAFTSNTGGVWVLRHVAVYGAAGVPIPIRDTLNIGGQPSNNTTATITGPSSDGINVDTNPADNRTDESKINDEDPDDGTFGLNGGDGLGSPSTLPRDITYTFDTPFNLKAIRWNIFGGRGQLQDYQVFVSLDGGPETLVDTNTTATTAFNPFYDPFDGIYAAGIIGDQLRIHVTSYASSDSTFPGEIEVFGSALAPEPASLGLLAVGGLTLLRRRRV